ncbi:hypothetical protein QCA50_003113 [Cerrena zonata]|uniref:Uncharacterized protein n=1 Tax=Cerrena zonata TaxID=2478898 RepID=A0AAW0GR61_9APHY
MNKLKELFGSTTSQEPSHSLVIAQYERADFTVGNEEEFHWALIVLTNVREQKGPSWQALEYNYSDGRGLVWRLVAADVGLPKSEKCFGGVRIGTIKSEDIATMDEIIKSNVPSPKFDGWTCRDWIMETLELIEPKGWVDPKVTTQSSLIPFMKKASQATQTKRETKKKREVVIVEFKEEGDE